MFRCDYHIHTAHSPDCCTPMEQQLLRAAELGLNEICITDHMEFGMRKWNGVETDFSACRDELELLRQRSGLPVVKFGAEAGVTCGEDDFLRLRSVLAEGGFDFVIASAHAIGDTDPFEPDFYRGMDFPAACRLYLEQLYSALLRLDVSCYSCVGHVDFPVKGWLRLGAESAELRYEYAPDALDAIFRLAIESGKCIEINTSPFALAGAGLAQALRRAGWRVCHHRLRQSPAGADRSGLRTGLRARPRCRHPLHRRLRCYGPAHDPHPRDLNRRKQS